MGNTFKFLFEYQEYIENIENGDKDIYIYNEILKRSKFGRLVLVEGLIHTQPVKKSVNILKRRFPELNIEIEEDGEIFISGLNDKIGKYLPLFTNLGYFISKLTINGEDWEINFKETDKPLAVYLEAKYDHEVDIPNILYHASPLKFKSKILKHGLSPRSGNKLSKHPDRIYLTNSENSAISFGNYLKNEEDNKWYEKGYCIYKVNGEALSKLYSDINFREGGFYTMNNIDPENLKLIKKIKN